MPVARRARPRPSEIPGAEVYLPETHTLKVLRSEVQNCRGCPLYKHATQAVFGEGPASARVMMIGEVPGDREDLAGHVFVGPAGKVLDDALAAVGIARDDVYLTNAVKHFKFTRRGKRRIHDKPLRYEIEACQPWLGAELEAVEPDVVVLLGAVAAQALLGSSFRVTKERGKDLGAELIGHAKHVIATVHPASVLRAPDDEARREAREDFIADLEVVAALLR